MEHPYLDIGECARHISFCLTGSDGSQETKAGFTKTWLKDSDESKWYLFVRICLVWGCVRCGVSLRKFGSVHP